jgi:hypothetical protein
MIMFQRSLAGESMWSRVWILGLMRLAICAIAGMTGAQAQSKTGAEIEALKQRTESLVQAGRYADAAETAKLALAGRAIRSRQPRSAWIVHSLAMLYLKQ